MIWRCYGISCFHFYFLFRNNGKRKQLDENDFRHWYGNFSSKVSFWKYLIAAVFKVLPRLIVEAPWQRHLKDTLRTWINKGVEPAVRRTLHQEMLLLYASLSITQTLVLNLTLCWSSNFHNNLFSFSHSYVLCILKIIQYLYAFFIRTSKIMMRPSFVFLWRFTAAKFYCFFYFPWNIRTC